jgi:hypothetical protein
MTLNEKLDQVRNLSELLDLWDDEWTVHYNFDEDLALSNAVRYGAPQFEKIVDEYLNG